MLQMEDALIASFSGLDPIYADGLAGILNLGANFQVLYFRWVPSQSGGTMEKTPVASIIRPKSSIVSCGPNNCAFLKWVEATKAPGWTEMPLH